MVDLCKPGHLTACLRCFQEAINCKDDNWDAQFGKPLPVPSQLFDNAYVLSFISCLLDSTETLQNETCICTCKSAYLAESSDHSGPSQPSEGCLRLKKICPLEGSGSPNEWKP